MKRLKKFNSFVIEEGLVAVGFGTPNTSASWNMTGAMRDKVTGYQMTPIAGRVKDLAMGVAQQGFYYQGNNNSDHSGSGYIKEAKNHIGNEIDEAYNSMSTETMDKPKGGAITEEYVEIINIDDALEDMKTGWDNWKGGPLTEPSDIKPAAKEFKAYITGWLNKNIK
jgi:hypothetical protein